MNNFRTGFFKFSAIFLVTVFLTACSGSESGESDSTDADATTVTIYKNPGCECCSRWAAYLEANGYRVTEEESPALMAIKSQNDVPYDMSSCHTAIIGDYVVEGHVPVEDIERLLTEQPDAAGIAVPGMPIGSPGMEGATVQNYEVFLFHADGSREVYAQH